MISVIVNDCNKHVLVCYPAYAKMKPVSVSFRTHRDILMIQRFRIMKFICSELRAFVNMRKFYWQYVGNISKEKQQAIYRIEYILHNYSEGSLERLANRIANARVSLSELMPIRKSPALTHFNTHIVPIIQYCAHLDHNYSSIVNKK